MTQEALKLLDDPRAPQAKDDRPGCGCLLVVREDRRLALPLRSVSFQARVRERIAEVTLEQTFENPYKELLEAVYIFPLSGSAAVSRFELHVGGKKLVGLVEERGEARRQYAEAIAQGKKAAILEQERDDVFTVKVGNLPPGEAATVKMVYGERLPAFDDGETELRIPLVVAPRYIPGSPLERSSTGEGTESDTTSVPDASRITPPRLAPGLRGDVALSISVALEGEGEVQDLGCTQHATKLGTGSGTITVALARKDELLDRDFVLRWRTASDEAKPVLLVARKGQSHYGLLSLVPPRSVRKGQGARDVLFLLDRSGSMEGAKLASAKKALRALLGTLEPHDRFSICTFESGRQWWGSPGSFTKAGSDSVLAAQRWLESVASGGGTELDPALQDSLAAFEARAKDKESEGRIGVLVLVTDGQVGNEAEILRRIESRIASLRVFTLGIDSAVNAAFLRRLAQLGRGTATLCEPGAGLEDALARIGREIGSPVLVDVEVEDRGLGLEADALTPERLPDLYAGRTASVLFKSKNGTGSVRVRARRAEGGSYEEVVKAETVELATLSQLWARSRVADLEDRYRLAYGGQGGGLEAARAEILELALEHQILTRFTAFLVVDHEEAERRLALPRRTVVQAVEQPAGWADREKMESSRGEGIVLNLARRMQASITGAAGAVFGAKLDAPASADKAYKLGGVPHRAKHASMEPFPHQILAGKDGAKAPPPPPTSPASAPSTDSDAQLVEMGSDESMETEAFELMEEDGADLGRDPYGMAERDDDFCAGTPPGAGGGGIFKRLFAPKPRNTPNPTPEEKPPLADLVDSKRAKELEKLSMRARNARSVGPKELETALEALSKELGTVLASLEGGRWPDAKRLEETRAKALESLVGSGLASKTAKLRELLEKTLVGLVFALERREGKLESLVGLIRAASEALAAQCRAELAPLLGKAGSFWEATV